MLAPAPRATLTINPVTYALCSDVSPSVAPPAGSSSAAPAGPLGYIRLATFNTQTADAFTDALAELKVRVAGGSGEGKQRYRLRADKALHSTTDVLEQRH